MTEAEFVDALATMECIDLLDCAAKARELEMHEALKQIQMALAVKRRRRKALN